MRSLFFVSLFVCFFNFYFTFFSSLFVQSHKLEFCGNLKYIKTGHILAKNQNARGRRWTNYWTIKVSSKRFRFQMLMTMKVISSSDVTIFQLCIACHLKSLEEKDLSSFFSFTYFAQNHSSLEGDWFFHWKIFITHLRPMFYFYNL